MDKDKLKTETHYSVTLKVKGEFETLDIIQESIERKAIKINFYE